jgi:hypothetical protein
MSKPTKEENEYCYLIADRLSDVIRLVVVLSVDKYSFRSEEGLNGILQDVPKSDSTWLNLAKQHPEFFRFNRERNSIILLIRFLQKVDVAEGELRDPLSVDQTQKLVDQAIALHDKQLARYQRDSYKTVTTSAYITAGAAIIVGIISLIISLSANNKNLEKDIKEIKTKIDSIYYHR